MRTQRNQVENGFVHVTNEIQKVILQNEIKALARTDARTHAHEHAYAQERYVPLTCGKRYVNLGMGSDADTSAMRDGWPYTYIANTTGHFVVW